MTARFSGKTAVVTGAGGDLGRATAVQLASEGASVALFDRKLDLMVQTEKECVAAGAPDVASYAVDQTDEAVVERTVAQVIGRLEGIDVLFANAGYGQFATFLDTTSRAWHRHVDVNLTGTFHVCQQVARAMVERRMGGAIVVNASSGAVQHADQLSAYCATKSALRMLAIGMASELGVHRIRVNSIMPGVIESGMTAPMLADERHREVILADTPVGRLGRPEDVAQLVCFLASDQAGYITGESILLDGGQVIHGHPRWFRTDYRNPHTESWEIGS
jgi:NAD(P)-dependent dehydrogenase (short-subunit alcohol dehydrogenase family)